MSRRPAVVHPAHHARFAISAQIALPVSETAVGFANPGTC